MMQPQVVFVDDCFKGNINPGTSEGARLYMKATAKKDEDDTFYLNIGNAQKVFRSYDKGHEHVWLEYFGTNDRNASKRIKEYPERP